MTPTDDKKAYLHSRSKALYDMAGRLNLYISQVPARSLKTERMEEDIIKIKDALTEFEAAFSFFKENQTSS
ncbi:MAG: hypothetical protein ACOX3W_03710 [Christensenellaceae bacterium]|jgi:hypothetical protein